MVVVLRVERPWRQAAAIARAVLHLTVLSLVLRGVITDPVCEAVLPGAMVAVATRVVVRTLHLPRKQVLVVLAIVAGSAAVPLALVFASGSVAFKGRCLLSLGGIVVGGSMTACTLIGRSSAEALRTGRDEIEGWLALGATPRQAASVPFRRAAATALMASTDQTRVTGLVTLNGAYVGATFGGAPVLDAAQFQLVLAAILTAVALTAAGWTAVFGAPRTLPVAHSQITTP